MAKLTIKPQAARDIAKIWQYTLDESNEKRAEELIATVNKTLFILTSHPDIGRVRDDLQPGIRSFPVGNYVILYTVIPDGVRVIRILHGAMDLPSHLNKTH